MGGRVAPVNDIQILQEMLSCDSKVPLQQGHDKPSVELNDKKSGVTAKIRGLPQDSIVIRAEDFENPLTIFDGSKGECKRADFVIVSNDSKKWIVCIETQSGNCKARKEVIEQLKGALCFVNYCKCIGKKFWLEEEFLDDYQIRFVSMVYTSSHKRKTRPNRPNALHSNPENFRKVPGRQRHFRDLI